MQLRSQLQVILLTLCLIHGCKMHRTEATSSRAASNYQYVAIPNLGGLYLLDNGKFVFLWKTQPGVHPYSYGTFSAKNHQILLQDRYALPIGFDLGVKPSERRVEAGERRLRVTDEIGKGLYAGFIDVEDDEGRELELSDDGYLVSVTSSFVVVKLYQRLVEPIVVPIDSNLVGDLDLRLNLYSNDFVGEYLRMRDLMFDCAKGTLSCTSMEPNACDTRLFEVEITRDTTGCIIKKQILSDKVRSKLTPVSWTYLNQGS